MFIHSTFNTRILSTNLLYFKGYGITGDLKLLIGMFSYVKEMIVNSASLVDLCELSQKVNSF